ncbi:MAG: lipopolysaccharide kinase InaA family protein [Pseudomonas sp.]
MSSNTRTAVPASPSDLRVFNQAMAGFLLKGHFRMADGHKPVPEREIPADFSGICVASMPDPDCDEQVIGYLRQLQTTQVRLDYSYDAVDNHGSRFLARLLDQGFKVMLRLIPPLDQAASMANVETQQRWHEFVDAVLQRFGSQLESVEIGNTVNRRRWSGYRTLNDFMIAWRIAHELVRRHGVTLAGPNVTDFEPPYNAGFLSVMSRHDLLPDIHTDNLFAERSIEPELYDHKVLGRLLAIWPKFNLVKKARLLGRLTEDYGVERIYSTTAFWTLSRIGRKLCDTEIKQADYLVRYMVLAAVSGGLHRAYWGPLVSQREGLVDDGTGRPAAHELVTRYDSNDGVLADYRLRPAFFAMAAFNQRIPGAFYQGKPVASETLQVHAFTRPDGQTMHVLWCCNGKVAVLSKLYSPEVLAQARCEDINGAEMQALPSLVTEAPIYLSWPQGCEVQADPQVCVLPDLCVYGSRAQGQHYHFSDGRWQGVVFAASQADADLLIERLHPEHIAGPSKNVMLRKARNVIWRVADPRNPERWLVAKKPNRLRLNKRITDYFKPSKAARSWNGANQLLRAGLGSPLPVAYFERADGKDTLNNWYVCEYAGEVPSVKEFFSAYARGEKTFKGATRDEFFKALCPFLLRLHKVGVYFRDLTGGNILVHQAEDGSLGFSLIDTARARFHPHSTRLPERLSDLKRTCYKLDWESRTAFMELYLGALGKRFHLLYRLPFHYFDFKMNTKRLLKGESWRKVPATPTVS